MNAVRVMNQLILPNWQLSRAFPAEILDNIEDAIENSEALHTAEIFFAVEGALDAHALRCGQSAKARALEVFSNLRVWDTEANNGVLIYLLLADREVEIIADRAAHAKVGIDGWQHICRAMEIAFKQANFEAGVLLGIEAITQHLISHFPKRQRGQIRPNELTNTPATLAVAPRQLKHWSAKYREHSGN